MTRYVRPIAMTDPCRSPDALPLAGGWTWFDHVEVLSRERPAQRLPVTELTEGERAALTSPRARLCGMNFAAPHLMGILNVTPDSFSDGGDHDAPAEAARVGAAMAAQGVSILDIGGESTRPGATPVSEEDEISRVVPALAAIRAAGVTTPVSVDTRNAAVAAAAFDAGATLFNDVSALTHDPASLPLAAKRRVPVCLMHAQGDPRMMQDAPRYDDVVLDVYDYLSTRVQVCVSAGIPRDRLIVDPGIGFGKTLDHNLILLRHLSLFHGLGCPILLGASRKRFIGTLGGADRAADRAPGSIAVALEALRQGVQILRVHDTAETAQAVALWTALNRLG